MEFLTEKLGFVAKNANIHRKTQLQNCILHGNRQKQVSSSLSHEKNQTLYRCLKLKKEKLPQS